jgi:hypothetical protein
VNDRAKRDILTLRLTVGFLGERAQYSWWSTSLFDSSAHLFLEPAFSRTSKLAQYHGIVEAARRQHDEHLSVGCYHLFRLPEEIEHALHDMMQTDERGDLARLALETKDAALEILKTTAAGYSSTSDGPVLVGTVDEIGTPKAIRMTAGVYLSAFMREKKAFPYYVRQ